MIFRRIKAHVAKEDWFAVFIDFIIVVFGVFMGFQVQQWNQERGDRQLEQQYLVRVLADVDESIKRTTAGRDFVIGHTSSAKMIQTSLRSCQLPDDQKDGFARGLFDLGKIVPATFLTGTIDEMQSSGTFSILRNADIRDSLNELIADAQNDQNIFPLIYENTVLETALIYANVVYLMDETTKIKWENVELDFDTMCQDKSIHAAISTLIVKDYENIDFLDRALDVLNRTKSALEEELG